MFHLTMHSTHFYLQLYGFRNMVKDHSDSEKGNPLPPHRLLLSIRKECHLLNHVLWVLHRGVNLYSLRISRTDVCDLHGRMMQSLRIFKIFTDSHLHSFHALYSNCCQFAVTPAMLCEHESKSSVTQQVVFCLFIVYGCVTVGSYTKIVFCNGVDNL